MSNSITKLHAGNSIAEERALVPFSENAGQSDHYAGGNAGDPALRYYGSLIWRSRWKIVTFVLVVTNVVTLFTLTLRKQYESTVTIRIGAPEG